MKLATLEKTLPLRAYPDEKLNTILLMDFVPYLTRLLSLTDELSTDRLEVALPAIKQQCIGMGFQEIKKMFETYADGNLSLKPIPNYFDRILLGKIVSEYKTKSKKPKIVEEKKITEQEQEFIMIEAVDRLEKEFKQNKEITSACVHVYDYLFAKGQLPRHDEEFRERIHKKAVLVAKSEAMSLAGQDYNFHRQLKDTLENIDSGKSDKVRPIAKRLVLEEYFKKLI